MKTRLSVWRYKQAVEELLDDQVSITESFKLLNNRAKPRRCEKIARDVLRGLVGSEAALTQV